MQYKYCFILSQNRKTKLSVGDEIVSVLHEMKKQRDEMQSLLAKWDTLYFVSDLYFSYTKGF